MFPFWESTIRPLIDTVDARRIVEIGALRGENTVQVLEALHPEAVFHVIDPVPMFDPEEHRRQFGDRYVFHEALSLEVLPDLEAMDVALIDGDHNWYTVYNELRLLAEGARREGRRLPLCILHDVLWPYGRRDLYYDPSNIPESERQPYAYKGMQRNRKGLAIAGGMNPGLANAVEEGGPRNGVMTGIDDFVAEYPEPLRMVVIPIYFGLAILAEEATIEEHPRLAAFLDEIESAEARLRYMETCEAIRLDGVVWNHSVEQFKDRKLDIANTRYFDLLKASLVNELYIEHEVRLNYVLDQHEKGLAPDAIVLQDPHRHLRRPMGTLQAARRAGRAETPADDPHGFYPWAPSGRYRLDRLHAQLDRIHESRTEGDFVDIHVGRGGTAMFMRAFLDIHQMNKPTLWVVDQFGVDIADTGDPRPANLNIVRDGFERYGLLDERVKFAQGPMPDALDGAELERIAALRIGGDDHDEVVGAFRAAYGRVVEGGEVFIDTHNPEAVEAITTLLREAGAVETLERIDASGLCWTKTSMVDLEAPTPHHPPRRPRLLSPVPGQSVDLSVVVVFYNMRREAERTLHSLSRSYQLDIEDVSYEVLVADNGSAPDQALDADWVRSFGPEFRLVDLGDSVSPSPTTALSAAMAQSRGDVIAMMIDGAHVLTPRVLHYGLLGLATYDPAVVLTQQWYLGPGQQHDAIVAGYDQAYEDRLLDEISWPADGYRLFEVGSFIGDRDWLDGMAESNCLFATRKLLEQVGGFDESFSIPGGSMSNLDLFERLGASPDITPVSILGEGSFHQVHGGTTTNNPDIDHRGVELTAYREEYTTLRGRPFAGHGKPIHYVGSLVGPSKRSKARRMTSATLFGAALEGGLDGKPVEPMLIPEELRTEFVDAYWRSLEWRGVKWLGRNTNTSPTDLMTYQQLVSEVRPDWIIDIGTRGGGRALFLASICDLLGHGRVVSVAPPSKATLTPHDRIEWIEADPRSPEAIERVHELVGSGRALLIMSLASRRVVLEQFEAYQSLVPVGSYAVFEQTIVNGHPVWASFGAGPTEAVRTLIRNTSDFYVDQSKESYAATMNVGGFLKRHR